ncbi:MAG: S8 family peptidase, partial [Saprospiraceae bacterium]|nr:S8 family peptidase [Saprospiraceae bacterium]
ANANTQIRFVGLDYADSEIHIDNVEIQFSSPSPYRAIVGADNLSLDGEGITVAVVDSGVSDHIDLHQNANNTIQAQGSSSRIVENLVFGDYASPNDEYVHGSHVAGIVGGNGVASNGKFKGVAPGVNLINVRVSNNQGLTYTSDLIDGLQWIYNNKTAYNIRVVNISINSTVAESYMYSPLAAAVEILWFNGIVVVVAAGNNGTADGPSTVYPPANDPFVITVGALEDFGTISVDDDLVGSFSAYNTTEDGFAKPDLVAPGRNLISLLPGTNATAYQGHLKHRVNEFYFRMSGTSMAAPVVTGTVALLLQDEPGLTPDQVKFRLMATANQNWPGYQQAKAGAGTVNAYAAVFGTTTESANQGIIPSQMLTTGDDSIAFDSVGWNSVGWNSVGWNSV